MKRLILAMLVITIGAGLYAQDNFFASKAGMVLTYANYDAKGSTESHTVMTIKDVKGSGKNMTVTYVSSSLDKNRKAIKDSQDITLQVVVKNGVAIMDMNQVIPAEMKAQGVKIDVSGIPVEYPSDLKAGQTLKPSEINMAMDLGIMKVNTVAKTVGKCLTIEDVKVPAGTYKCHKISQTITTTAMGINTVATCVTWLAPGIGTVKSETYDDKNKLTSSFALVELKGK